MTNFILAFCFSFLVGYAFGFLVYLFRQMWIESGKRAEEFRKATHSPA